MIISDEQARLAAEHLRNQASKGANGANREVSSEVLAAAAKIAASAPDVRTERLEEARMRLEAAGQPAADEIARKMLSRIVSDALR